MSLEEFVGEIGKTANVSLSNFKNLFTALVGFYLVLLLCFLVHKGRRKLKKGLRKLLRNAKATLSSFSDFWNRIRISFGIRS